MIPHPPELDAAYGVQPWAPYVRVTVVSPAGAESVLPATTDGTLIRDDTAWPRDTLTLVVPTGITPAVTAPPVSPWGGQVRVESGARILGRLFPFTLATLDITETVVDRPNGTISLTAVSREARVNEARYGPPTPTAAGATSAVVTGLVRRGVPSCPVSWQASNDPTLAAGAILVDDDVWPIVDQLCDGAAAEAFFDQSGTLVVRNTPVKVSSSPALLAAVGPGGAVTGYQSTRRWAFNRVHTVYTDASTTPATTRVGTWSRTTGLTSSTGPYGVHARRDTFDVDAGKLPTQAAADAAAAATARRAAAPFRTVVVRAIPAPWLTPGDTIRVRLLGNDTTEDLLVSRVDLPVSGLDVMTVTCRDDDPATSGA